MAGPSRAAPPMPDPLDPADFAAPPPADPVADYRVLLDAMRQAGAHGLAHPSAALVQPHEQAAPHPPHWGPRTGTARTEQRQQRKESTDTTNSRWAHHHKK